MNEGLVSGQDSDIQQVTHLLTHQPDTVTVGTTCRIQASVNFFLFYCEVVVQVYLFACGCILV